MPIAMATTGNPASMTIIPLYNSNTTYTRTTATVGMLCSNQTVYAPAWQMLYPRAASLVTELGGSVEFSVGGYRLPRDRFDSADFTAEEREQLEEKGYLEVPSRLRADHHRVYRIPAASGSEVDVFEEGQRIESLCLQSIEPLSTPAWVAMQKLLILCDERRYLSRANHWAPGPRPVEVTQRARAREREVRERLVALGELARAS